MKILLDFDFRFVALMILTFANLDCCQLRCDIMSGIKKQLPVVFRSLRVLETWSSGWVESWKTTLLVKNVSTMWAEVIFRFKSIDDLCIGCRIVSHQQQHSFSGHTHSDDQMSLNLEDWRMLFLQPFAQGQNFCENPWKFSKTRILMQILAFFSVYGLKVCSIPNNSVMASEFRSHI